MKTYSPIDNIVSRDTQADLDRLQTHFESLGLRTLASVMARFCCSEADALRYMDLRDEGYSVTQAALMAGISDPPEPDERTE